MPINRRTFTASLGALGAALGAILPSKAATAVPTVDPRALASAEATRRFKDNPGASRIVHYANEPFFRLVDGWNEVPLSNEIDVEAGKRFLEDARAKAERKADRLHGEWGERPLGTGHNGKAEWVDFPETTPGLVAALQAKLRREEIEEEIRYLQYERDYLSC